METHLEKRKCRRYQARLPLQAEFEILRQPLSGQTLNISSRGAFFTIPRTEAVQMGWRVSLEILVPEDFVFSRSAAAGRKFRICASARVVRVLHDGEMDITRVAVEFSRHRLVRDDAAGSDLETATDISQASFSPQSAALGSPEVVPAFSERPSRQR